MVVGAACAAIPIALSGPGAQPSPLDTAIPLAVSLLVSSSVALLAGALLTDRFASLTPAPRDLPRGALWTAGVLPVVLLSAAASSVVSALLRGTPGPTIAHEGLAAIVADPWSLASLLSVVSAVLLAPIAEEVFFRGCLQNIIRRIAVAFTLPERIAARGAVLATAALFAWTHLGVLTAGALHALVPLFVLGIFLGWAFERTRRVGVCIVIHALYNFANVALALALAPAGTQP